MRWAAFLFMNFPGKIISSVGEVCVTYSYAAVVDPVVRRTVLARAKVFSDQGFLLFQRTFRQADAGHKYRPFTITDMPNAEEPAHSC
jgi:hypothetical protein